MRDLICEASSDSGAAWWMFRMCPLVIALLFSAASTWSRGGTAGAKKGEVVASGEDLQAPFLEPEEGGTWVVKSRVVLPFRQLLLWLQITYCVIRVLGAVDEALHHHDLGSLLDAILLTFLWCWILVSDSVTFRLASLRRCASVWLPAAVLACTLLQSASFHHCEVSLEASSVSTTLMTQSIFFVYGWLLLAFCVWAACTPVGAEERRREPNPEEVCYDLHAILTFSWFDPILRVGANQDRQVAPSDLPPLMVADTARQSWTRFKAILGDREKYDYGKPRRLWLQLWNMSLPWFLPAGLLRFVSWHASILLSAATYVLLQYLEGSMEDGPSFFSPIPTHRSRFTIPPFPATLFSSLTLRFRTGPLVKWCVAAYFIGPAVNGYCGIISDQLSRRVAIRSRAAMCQLLYRKGLRIDLAAQDTKVGEIVNLMSNDVQNILDAVAYFHDLWVPIPLFILSVVGLQIVLKPGWLGALAFLIFAVPVNWVSVYYIIKHQKSVASKKDDRLGIISEVLQGVRIIKLCALEPGFITKVQSKRLEELAVLRKFFDWLIFCKIQMKRSAHYPRIPIAACSSFSPTPSCCISFMLPLACRPPSWDFPSFFHCT